MIIVHQGDDENVEELTMRVVEIIVPDIRTTVSVIVQSQDISVMMVTVKILIIQVSAVLALERV